MIEMPSLIIEGHPLFYSRHVPSRPGQGPPLVLVHGAGGDHLHWPPHLRRLPMTAVFALDLPGHGQSTGPGRNTIAGYTAVIKAFAEALALPPFVLAGHSMGGAIALDFALHHGDRLAGLALVGASARLRVNPAILDGLTNDFAATTAQLIDWLYTPAFPPAQRERALARLRTNDPQILHDDFAACDAFDIRCQVSALTLPTLIICGVADKMTPVKLSAALHHAIPGSQLYLVENAGHMVMIEQPAVVTALVREFLARQEAKKSGRVEEGETRSV